MIKTKHALCITLLFSMGNTIVNIGSRGHHSWQALVIAYLIMLPLMFLFQYLLNKYPGDDLFTVIKKRLPRILSILIMILYIILLFYISARVIYNYSSFVITIIATNYEYISILFILIILITWYLLKSGLKNIGKFSQVASIITISMIILISFLSLQNVFTKYLLPIIPVYTDEFFNNVLSFMIQPFGEMIVLYNVFCKIEECKSKKKIFLYSSIVSFIVLEIILLFSISILGNNYILNTNYPYFSAIAIINFLGFIARIESITIILYFFSFIIKYVICIYSISIALKRIFKIKYEKSIFLPIIILSFGLSMIQYNNISEINIIAPYYCVIQLFFSLVVPLLLFFITIYNKKEIINIV